MTLSRRNSRLIVVDRITYRWHVDRMRYRQWGEPVIWRSVTIHQVLDKPQRPGALLHATVTSFGVRPAAVAAAIKSALAKGWRPALPGPPVYEKVDDPVLLAAPCPGRPS